MTVLTRLALVAVLIGIIAFIFTFFRRLGWGEVAIVVAIVALAFIVEIVRYLVNQVKKGYRG
jgi:hypothetical protein